ncbi:hypothetical protein E2542_SST21379 [Spatholobus suberectus]|nr:hypothetical protein E2542_SST21379 [Spatholobus suberectus]
MNMGLTILPRSIPCLYVPCSFSFVLAFSRKISRYLRTNTKEEASSSILSLLALSFGFRFRTLLFTVTDAFTFILDRNGKPNPQLRMEANQRRVLPRRKPLSDCTNNTSPSVPLKPHKTNPSSSSSSLKKPATECTSATTTDLDNAPNPTSPSTPIPSTPSLTTPAPHEIVLSYVDVEASEPISVVYSRRSYSNKRRKDKGKAVAVPVSRTPNLKISDSREKNDEFEGVNLPKAKALTVPRTKKQRALSSEKDMFKDRQLQDFIEKQKAYFKEVDEFELLVESGDELD